MKNKTITVKLIKSISGNTSKVKDTIHGLGLRRIGHEKKLENTPCVRGMIKKIIHLVEIK